MAINYAKVVQVVGEPIDTVIVRSELAGETYEARVKARVVVNAAGPWVDAIRGLEEAGATPRLTLTKGVHVVLPHARVPINHTVILRGADKRGLFAVPRGGFTYLGTTDTFYPEADTWPEITPADIQYMFDAAQRSLKIAPLTMTDIVAVWSGVRPLVAQAGKSPSEISRRDEVWTGPSGMITIAGGKLSAYRAMAERIVDTVVERLGKPARPVSTGEVFLPGGVYDPAALAATPALVALGDAARA